jgi:hypothetical protein
VHFWKTARVSPLLGFWWAFWLFSASGGRAAARLSARANTTQQLLLASQVSLVADLLEVLAAFLALAVVFRVHGMQQRLYGMLMDMAFEKKRAAEGAAPPIDDPSAERRDDLDAFL